MHELKARMPILFTCTSPLMRVWGCSGLYGARCVGVGRREPEVFHSFIRRERSVRQIHSNKTPRTSPSGQSLSLRCVAVGRGAARGLVRRPVRVASRARECALEASHSAERWLRLRMNRLFFFSDATSCATTGVGATRSASRPMVENGECLIRALMFRL